MIPNLWWERALLGFTIGLGWFTAAAVVSTIVAFFSRRDR